MMTESKIWPGLAQKEITADGLAAQVSAQPDLLPEIFAGLNAKPAHIKYGCLKVLQLLSEQQPELLYPRFDFLVKLMDSEVTFFKWGAILMLAQLTRVDAGHKFEPIFEKYFAPITGPVMIPAANVIRSAATIASAKPELTERITQEILKVESARYQTDECRNVAIGHAIKAFSEFFGQIKARAPVLEFVKRQLANSRSGTQRAAVKFMKKYTK
jgi:hypothetical protein